MPAVGTRKSVEDQRPNLNDADARVLEKFVLDNPELERLEALLDQFNPFVAMRWTRQETRHSSFLRWLLDPSETHGLGDYFLRQFLKRIASLSSQTSELSVVDLDSWVYVGAQVQAEWNNIDLLIRDDQHKVIVVVENKVDSDEHSDQLNRYRALIEKQFPSHKKLFVYLTIAGGEASDQSFLAMGYAELVRLVQDVIARRHDQLHPDVAGFMKFYVEMLRRHIVEDSEVHVLCEKIYKTHRRALDILFEYKPDRASELKEYLLGLIGQIDQLTADHSTKSYVRFCPKAWEFFPLHGEGWTPSKRLVLVEIDQSGGDVKAKIILGPGKKESRERIRSAIATQPVFNRAATRLYPRWWSFHSETWVTKKQYEESDMEALKAQIRSRFEHFMLDELRQMVKALDGLRGEQWD